MQRTSSPETISISHDGPVDSLTRRAVVVAVLRFNLRLFLDGAKDVILAPLSLLTGCIALMLPSHRAPSPLRFLVRTARRLDDAIDLCDLPELRRASPTPVALPAARDGRDPTDLATSLAGSGDPSAVHEA